MALPPPAAAAGMGGMGGLSLSPLGAPAGQPPLQPQLPPPGAPLFGVIFLGASFPITAEYFTRVDSTHWTLDVASLVSPDIHRLKELALFLVAPGALDPALALGCYVRAGGSDWLYRGAVHAGHPSEAMPLQWPVAAPPEGGNPAPMAPGAALVGVSVEPAAALAEKEGSRLGERLAFGRRVGQDVFDFLGSFATAAGGDALLVPANALNKWWQRFESKLCKER